MDEESGPMDTSVRRCSGRGGKGRGASRCSLTTTSPPAPSPPPASSPVPRCSGPTGDGSLLARLSLEEPADEGRHVLPPYHAYAPSGGAVAEAVFVNLGREEDYVALKRLGVDVRGRVAVAPRGRVPVIRSPPGGPPPAVRGVWGSTIRHSAAVPDYPMLTSTALLDPFDNLARSNASLCGTPNGISKMVD